MEDNKTNENIELVCMCVKREGGGWCNKTSCSKLIFGQIFSIGIQFLFLVEAADRDCQS